MSRTRFALLLTLASGLAIEAFCQGAYRLKTGRWLFRLSTAVFPVRDIDLPVADARRFTLKPDYLNEHYDKDVGFPGYRLSTDALGFRRGPREVTPHCRSIVFLGDSVPFGWGIEDSAAIPSRLSARLAAVGDPRCVINAAAPSYSMFQAISRFREEVRKGLEEFVSLARRSGAKRVILAPVTVPKSAFARLPPVLKRTISLQNEEFRRCSEADPGHVVYFDTQEVLSSFKESNVFIDECCHLSRKGADVVSSALFDLLKPIGR